MRAGEQGEQHPMNDDLSAFVIPSELCRALRNARHVAVLTGAGISAESGVPTFRDVMTELWAQYNPQDLATPQAFARDPQLVWEWDAWLVSKVKPNAGHRALAELERRVPRFTPITQNVDGLHQRAGSQRVVELHGNITRVKCFDEGTVMEQWEKTGEVPPRCPNCGGLLRPDVVWGSAARTGFHGGGKGRAHMRCVSLYWHVRRCRTSRVAASGRAAAGCACGACQPGGDAAADRAGGFSARSCWPCAANTGARDLARVGMSSASVSPL